MTSSSPQLHIEVPAAVAQVRITATAGGEEVAAIRGGWMPPLAEPQAPLQAWSHSHRSDEPAGLAGMSGRLTADTFEAPGSELVREVWMSDEGTTLALRHRLISRAEETIYLDALLPLRCDGSDSLLVQGEGGEAWDVLVQKRFKNDAPTAFRPGVRDADLQMAEKSLGPTGERIEEHGDEISVVRADTFCMIRQRGHVGGTALPLGYLSQTGHLARVVLQFANAVEGNEQGELQHLTAECEFDGVAVEPGEEKASQWLMISVGEPNELISSFADRVGIYHGVDRPSGQPPSVWCGFYVYGEYYAEQYFDEDMEDLAARPVPFDVFMIDGGWERNRGDWEPHREWWPGGMKKVAERITALGYRPALWTSPYIIHKEAPVALEHPEWMARNANGGHQEYMGLVLDTTYPGVCDYLEELYRKLTFEWGFHFHKFDFMRGIFNDPDIRFHDPRATRLDAYTRGLEAIRRGTGPDAYICVCGGHYGGSLGLADSQRSGSDVKAWWEVMKPRLKQALMRTWMHRLWHVDADAMLLRRREEPLLDNNHGVYSLGKLTDDEAQLVALTQYLSGQLITLAEKFRDLDEDRRALMRHTFPSIDAAAMPLDPFEPVAPSLMVTRIQPKCEQLGPWHTLAVINWDDEPKSMMTTLEGVVIAGLGADRFLVTEFFSGESLGLFGAGDRVEAGLLRPHSCRLLRIAPWDGIAPILAGTDLSFSGGGIEVAEWQPELGGGHVSGRIDTDWDFPVRVAVAFPSGEGCQVVETTVASGGGGAFRIAKP